MPTAIKKNPKDVNLRQFFSNRPVASVEIFYSNIRKGKPLFGLIFYDTFG